MSTAEESAYTQLAQEHQRQQVAEAAAVIAALGFYWRRTLTARDLEGSFGRFMLVAAPIVAAGRARSEVIAQFYYTILKDYAGLAAPLAIEAQPFVLPQVTASLHATGVGSAKRAIGLGRPAPAAIAQGGARMLNAAKRHTLDAGRQRLIDLSVRDEDVRGWARVSDGDPCYYCAELLARGPIYSDRVVTFKAHDECGCGVRPIVKGDDDPYTRAARALSDLYDEDPATFRSRLPEARASGFLY